MSENYPEDFDNPQLEPEVLLPEVFITDERTVQAAHDNIVQSEAPSPYVRRSRKSTTPRNGEVETRGPDPDLVEYAAQMAGGDRRRLIFNRDGTIVIAKHPVRKK